MGSRDLAAGLAQAARQASQPETSGGLAGVGGGLAGVGGGLAGVGGGLAGVGGGLAGVGGGLAGVGGGLAGVGGGAPCGPGETAGWSWGITGVPTSDVGFVLTRAGRLVSSSRVSAR
jgi:hypothetical protein